MLTGIRSEPLLIPGLAAASGRGSGATTPNGSFGGDPSPLPSHFQSHNVRSGISGPPTVTTVRPQGLTVTNNYLILLSRTFHPIIHGNTLSPIVPQPARASSPKFVADMWRRRSEQLSLPALRRFDLKPRENTAGTRGFGLGNFNFSLVLLEHGETTGREEQ